jgi:hypothetical protein
LIRNYYETAHAKGPQDAVGGFLKNQADYAVLRGKATIQCAKDLYKFAEENPQQPKCKNGNYKRRIFRYVESIPRDNNRNFKPVSQNRKVHQIISGTVQGNLLTGICPVMIVTNVLWVVFTTAKIFHILAGLGKSRCNSQIALP